MVLFFWALCKVPFSSDCYFLWLFLEVSSILRGCVLFITFRGLIIPFWCLFDSVFAVVVVVFFVDMSSLAFLRAPFFSVCFSGRRPHVPQAVAA